MPKVIGIIPARYASTRFPGKPLVDLGGKSMISRVYEQARKSKMLAAVCVATDDNRIFDHVRQQGYDVVMTSVSHTNGTERCLEALNLQKDQFNFVINIQGDEPFINPIQIDTLAGALSEQIEIATLAKKITDPVLLDSPNCVKVVFSYQKDALYFSRSCIPHIRGIEKNGWPAVFDFYKHVGIYAYRTDVLRKITNLPASELEKAESLEQLRWLEHGYRIKIVETDMETIGIDSPEDIAKASRLYGFGS